MACAPLCLFVYGTLRRGETAHGLLRGARFIGLARTAPRFELVDLGAYPALVQGGATAVAGELYEVAAEAFAALDAYEGCPELYTRSEVELAEGGVAQAYLLDPDRARGLPRVASGDWITRGRPRRSKRKIS